MVEFFSFKDLVLFVLWFAITFTFSLFGGHGALLRAVLFLFGIPADVAISSLLTSSVASRSASLYVLNQKKFIDWKLAGMMVVISTLSGVASTYVLLIMDSRIIELIVGVMLLGGALGFIIKKYSKKILSKERRVPTSLLPYMKPFYILVIFVADTLATITGGIGLLSMIILKKYFHKTIQQAAAALKIGGMFKSVIVAGTLILAGKYDIGVLLIIMPAGALGGYFGTLYFSDKSDKVLERLMCVISLAMGVYLLGKNFV